MHYDNEREKELFKPWLMKGDCLGANERNT